MLTALILSGLTGLATFLCIRLLRERSSSPVEETRTAEAGSSLDRALSYLIHDLSHDHGARRTLLSATPPPVRAITNAPVAERTRFPRGTPTDAVTVSFRSRAPATPAEVVLVVSAPPPAGAFADEVPTVSARAHAVRPELPIRRRAHARAARA